MVQEIEEIWLPVIGYEGLYEISNLGKIKSLPKCRGTKYSCPIEIGLMKHSISDDGYHRVPLCKNGVKKTNFPHILVAKHFIPNPENKPEVNHENGDKDCNEYWNLKWCTRKENEEHAYRTGLKGVGNRHWRSKPIGQYTKQGQLIKTYTNASIAGQTTSYDRSVIQRCARGVISQAYGFVWKYENILRK